MRRWFPRLSFLVALAFGASAFAQAALPTKFSETQTCTAGTCSRSAPTTTAEGMSLFTVAGFRLSVCAATSQTLSGAGTMQAWLCDSTSALCMRNPSLDVSVTASGVQCQVFPDNPVSFISYAPDTVVFQASGVTVSGGASITVRIYPQLVLR